MIWLAAASCLVACWTLGPGPGARAQRILQDAQRRERSLGWLRWGWLLAGLGVLGLAAPRLLVWVVPGLVAVLTAGWLIAQSRAERQRQTNAEEVVQACQAVAAQLRVGDIPAVALARVAADSPLLAPVAATQAIGADVPAALRAAGQQPGGAGLASLGRAWQLCQLTGAPVARAANQVADSLRAEAAAERLVASELAAPRASGRLLAGLPLLGLGMGFAGGGNPIDFLTGTLVGQLCLAAAVCLVCAGLVWTTLLGRLPPIGDEES